MTKKRCPHCRRLFLVSSRKLDGIGWNRGQVENVAQDLAEDLSGDVKKLTNFTPEHRLRVGSYRILFEIENGNCAMVYRVLHRREVYRKR